MDFSLAQHCLLWPFGSEPGGGRSLSLSLCCSKSFIGNFKKNQIGLTSHSVLLILESLFEMSSFLSLFFLFFFFKESFAPKKAHSSFIISVRKSALS